MGWMQRATETRAKTRHLHFSGPLLGDPHELKLKDHDAFDMTDVQHVELPQDATAFKTVSPFVADEALPSIPSEVVMRSSESGLLWIVVDDIVYDCGGFVDDHPGGPSVLEPFWASDCSWQFRRFHPKTTLRDQGRALRIGRTTGVPNKFKERPRFVGLRRLGYHD